ncbi:L,D-transpeptidase family protein [Adhaeribacter aquaticus]|uniref:L,D-transpeptidase family protein n=1 Tax=Adhaeribacter aquaticus TaxID=299567 RepID=UPI0003F7697F|nr:L,D-transpeptidase family protein [Adhaeribacter aquaticus]
MTKKIIKLFAAIFFVGLTIYYFFPDRKLPNETRITKLVVLKSERKLLVYDNKKLIKTYKVALGRNPIGDKKVEGDKKTPEGIYYINDKNPNSGYHKNLGISYPNADDIAQAKKLSKSVGGAIKIHGLKNGRGYIGKFHRWKDWTLGCIALTNSEIDELYGAVRLGTPINIKP